MTQETRLGPLYRYQNVRTTRPNGYRESGARKERRVGATGSRVEEVSLAERDASHGGSDLPNWVGQVIGWIRKGTKSTRRERGVETRVGRPHEWSGSRVGQRIGAESERTKREEMWYEDEGHETSDEIENAGTRTLDEMRRERTLRGYEDVMPGTLRPGLMRGNERAREGEVVKSRRKREEPALLEDMRR